MQSCLWWLEGKKAWKIPAYSNIISIILKYWKPVWQEDETHIYTVGKLSSRWIIQGNHYKWQMPWQTVTHIHKHCSPGTSMNTVCSLRSRWAICVSKMRSQRCVCAFIEVCVFFFYLVMPRSHSTSRVLVYRHGVSHLHSNSCNGHHQIRSGAQGTQCSSICLDLGSPGRTGHTPCSLAHHCWSPGAAVELVVQQTRLEIHRYRKVRWI